MLKLTFLLQNSKKELFLSTKLMIEASQKKVIDVNLKINTGMPREIKFHTFHEEDLDEEISEEDADEIFFTTVANPGQKLFSMIRHSNPEESQSNDLPIKNNGIMSLLADEGEIDEIDSIDLNSSQRKKRNLGHSKLEEAKANEIENERHEKPVSDSVNKIVEEVKRSDDDDKQDRMDILSGSGADDALSISSRQTEMGGQEEMLSEGCSPMKIESCFGSDANNKSIKKKSSQESRRELEQEEDLNTRRKKMKC
jgi:hypothetical protein